MRYIIILTFLSVHSFVLGQSISEPVQSNKYQKLEQEFQTARIETARLPAFEKRAIQKAKDMFNYIEIISNKAYDEALRKEAMKMAIDLFAKGASAKSEILTGTKVKNYDISSFYSGVFKTSLSQIKVSVSNAKVLEKLVFDNSKSLYKGRLVVHLSISRAGTTKLFERDYLVDYQVSKVLKSFGDKREQVWALLLSDWYPRP